MFSSNTTQVSDGGYQISRSLRFNSADSAYLARTPSTNGSGTKGTFNFWVKRSNNRTDGEPDNIYTSAESASNQLRSILDLSTSGGSNNLRFYGYNSGGSLVLQLETTAVLRDPSAWYCITVNFDTTQATSANRAKVYINNVEQTAFNTATYPAQNTELGFFKNLSAGLNIGSNRGGNAPFASLYLADFNGIDGTALTPSSFGETNAQTGVWQPKAYSGSYGTNGFYLNFSDNSNTTAATLGKDYSGNGNNWTPNNFSVTAGAGNDSLVDSPTSYGVDTGVGGTVRGNYCTLNPLTTTAGTYTQGNLRYTGPTSWRRSNATISRATGQWYWEVTLGNAPFPSRLSGEWNAFGFGLATTFNSTNTPPLQTDAVILADNGYYKNFSGSWTDGGSAFSSGDVLSIAVDLDANTFTFRRNNTSVATGTIGGTVGRELVPIIISYDGQYGVMDCNFGQRPFAYTAPSGFKALCTQNLPTPTIGATTATQAGKFFNPVLYTGTGATRTVTGVNFSPDLVWIKSRSAAYNNRLYDKLRGVENVLQSNSTAAEGSDGGGLTAFGSDGFTLGSSVSQNESASTFVAWNWKANGSGSTNTSGSITSTVSANTTSGFSVVTYTGTGANATVGHGLGVAPKMVIIKGRGNADNWIVYNAFISSPTTYALILNSNIAPDNDPTYFNSTAPTSTVFSVGTDASTNQNTIGFVAYCFAPIAGYSAFGSYTGNGSADGPFVFTGMRPAFVLTKRTDSASDWQLMDLSRDTYNVANKALFPNYALAESTGYSKDFLSNGFKIRDSGASLNASGGTFIYMAFASNPFKYSLAR